jgi:hypothetical protein
VLKINEGMMATWIVHLRIAEELLARIPGLDPARFAIGNIAPDSGIPDENWEKFYPPPEVTHFQNEASPQRDLADLAFFRQYVLPLLAEPLDPQDFSFRWGYFCHLVTDNLWSQEIGRPTKARFAQQFAANPKFIWEVKEDWYGLDFIYVRDHPDCLFWKIFLGVGIEETGLDFLPVAALKQRIDYIKEYYQRQDDEIQALFRRPYIYLSQAEMERFVTLAVDRLESCYQQLCGPGAVIPPEASILESSPA